MSKKTQVLPAAQPEQLRLNASVTTDDMIAIMSSRAEERCCTEVQSLRKDLLSLQEEVNDRSEALIASKEKLMEKAAKGVLSKAATKQLKELGLDISWSLASQDKRSMEVCVLLKREKTGDNYARYGTGSVELSNLRVELPKELLEEATKVDQARNRLHELEDEIITWRRRESSIPSLERRYRGKLAEHKLRQLGESELLSLLTSELDSELLRLT